MLVFPKRPLRRRMGIVNPTRCDVALGMVWFALAWLWVGLTVVWIGVGLGCGSLGLASDLLLPQLFTTSVFPLIFKVRFIFVPLVSTCAILSTNPQKNILQQTLVVPHLHQMISLCIHTWRGPVFQVAHNVAQIATETTLSLWEPKGIAGSQRQLKGAKESQREPNGADGNHREPQ